MLSRVDSFFDFLAVDEAERQRAEKLAVEVSERAGDMMDTEDYYALGALLLAERPRRIFEIGTYLGMTSNFFLDLLPDCEVVSIAYSTPRLQLLRRRVFIGKAYNNSELSRREIGSHVSEQNRHRFTQLIGDSHTLRADRLIQQHGAFDMVFVDGDHSADGVAQDTALARALLGEGGVIAWHDANPKDSYLAVREYLENEMMLPAIATPDRYIGGVAAWSPTIARRLSGTA